MKVLLVVGPENENRFSMTNYTNICKKIYREKGYDVSILRLKLINSKNKILIFLARYLFVPIQLLGKEAELIHLMDHSYGHSLLFTNKKCITTIHDLIPLEFNFCRNQIKSIISKIIFSLIIKIIIKKSSNIIVVSKTTQNLLKNYFKISERKLILAYNPPLNRKLEIFKDKKKDIDILLIGKNFYKNNIYAVKSCLNIKMKLNIIWINPDYNLVKLFKNSDHIVKTYCFLDDKYLFEIYHKSKIILNLSFSEGFGWLPFEASKYNCCSIMSDIRIFRELHPSSVEFLQPLDNEILVSNFIKKVLNSKNLRNKLLNNIFSDYEKLKKTKYSLKNFLNNINCI